MDIAKDPIKLNKKLDLIFSSNTLEHIDLKSVNLVVEYCAKNLNNGGKLVLIGPNFKYSYKDY
jgi:predicted SAM-dependent methyltransferase